MAHRASIIEVTNRAAPYLGIFPGIPHVPLDAEPNAEQSAQALAQLQQASTPCKRAWRNFFPVYRILSFFCCVCRRCVDPPSCGRPARHVSTRTRSFPRAVNLFH